jgi:hypothetical protein
MGRGFKALKSVFSCCSIPHDPYRLKIGTSIFDLDVPLFSSSGQWVLRRYGPVVVVGFVLTELAGESSGSNVGKSFPGLLWF